MRIGGISSGFDTEQIVSQLMQVERQPLDRIYRQKVKAEWQRDAYRALNTKIAAFRDFLFNMRLQSTYRALKVTSSNEAAVTAKGAANLQAGTYEIKVNKLATSATLFTENNVKSNFTEFVQGISDDAGLTIQMCSKKAVDGAEPEYINITISKGETLESFMAKINNNKDLGITVFYDEVQDKLVFRTRDTGASADVGFNVNDENTVRFVNKVLFNEPLPQESAPESSEPTEVNLTVSSKYYHSDYKKAGSNAKFVINGLETEREQNRFTIAGLDIELKAETTGPVKIEVKQDTEGIFETIKSFVNQYNELIAEINSKLTEPFYRDYEPLTDAQKEEMSDKEIEMWEEKAKSGLLRSDPILSRIVSEMRSVMGSIVEGLDGINSLYKIGISTANWQENGKLYINEEKLKNAIADHPEEIMALFTNNSDDPKALGIARKLTQVLDDGLERLTNTAGKASRLYDQSTLSERIRDYEKKIAEMEERLIRIENRYWAQFTAMEKALSAMYSQSDWLYQQLSVLGK